jgi:hypothetical protein
LYRLSRSRSNSQSYVDQYSQNSPHDSKYNSASYDDAKFADEKYAVAGERDTSRPGSSRQANNASLERDNSLGKEAGMYARQNQPQEVSGGQYQSPPVSAGGPRSGGMSNGYNSYDSGMRDAAPQKSEPTPDLLLQAFNQALRPYTDKVETLESEIADLRAYIDQLESQRGEVHAWIDKRGLRPGKAAQLLLLDRTMVLTQLHRRPTEHRTPNGQFIPLLLTHPRRRNPQRPT